MVKGVCKKGHIISGNNGYRIPSTGRLRCLKCKQEYHLQWTRENRGSEWTGAKYKTAMDKQCGKCAICGNLPEEGRKLQGDHNHKTGKSRELLCIICNMVLGMFNEDVNLFNKAASYLQKHNAQ
jgi:hypothetical protein